MSRNCLGKCSTPNQLTKRPWAGRAARAPPPLRLRLCRQPLCRLRLCRLRCRLLGLQRRLHGAGQTEQARLWVRLLGRKAYSKTTGMETKYAPGARSLRDWQAQLAVHVATPSVDLPLQGERQRVRSASRDVASRGQRDRREERRVDSVDEPLLPRHERGGIERLHRPADGRGEGRHVSSADLRFGWGIGRLGEQRRSASGSGTEKGNSYTAKATAKNCRHCCWSGSGLGL